MFPLGKEPRHMLPSQAAVNLCSLQPGFERVTLSVVIKMDSDGKLSGAPEVSRSIIINKKAFSHAEVKFFFDYFIDSLQVVSKGSIKCEMIKYINGINVFEKLNLREIEAFFHRSNCKNNSSQHLPFTKKLKRFLVTWLVHLFPGSLYVES